MTLRDKSNCDCIVKVVEVVYIVMMARVATGLSKGRGLTKTAARASSAKAGSANRLRALEKEVAELKARLNLAGKLRPARQTPGLDASAGPRARAILRGKEIAQRDVAESGGIYSLEEVRSLLNDVSRQSVERRVREGRLLAVIGANNKRLYPAAQFNDDGSVVEGLRAIQDAMATRNGFAVLNFLVNPAPQLDNLKPVDLLKKGELQKVVEAAKRVGEPGG